MSEPRRYESLDLRDLKETFLECNVCFDTFDQTDKRPRLLHSCLHSFCTECLERLLAKEGKKQITCPLCRRVQKITGSVQALPIDPVRNKLVDYIQLKKKKTTLCTDCEKGAAVSKCQECQFYLCKDCNDAHKKYKSTRDHAIISLEEVLEQPIKSLSAGHMCPKHPKHHLEFYCTTDDELCCVSCTVLNHKGHDHVGLEDAHANKGKEVEALLSDGRVKADKIRAAKQQFTKHQRQIVDTKSKSKDDIAAMFCVLRKALDQRERSLVASLDDKANQLMSSIKKTTDAFDDTIAVIESTETYYSEAKEKADVVEMLKLYPTFTRSLQGIEAPQSPGGLEGAISSVTFLRKGDTEAETIIRGFGEFDKVSTRTKLKTTTIDVPLYIWRFFQRYHRDNVQEVTLHFDSGILEICGPFEIVKDAQKYIENILCSKMTAEVLTITKPAFFRSVLPCLVTYVEGRERCVIVDKVEELEASGKELELEGAVGGVGSTGADGSPGYGGYGEETMGARGLGREEQERGQNAHGRSGGEEWKQLGRRGRSRHNRDSQSPGKLCPTVKIGEIASEKVDVIVNPTNPSMTLSRGAVSQSILKLGGDSIQQECSKKVPSLFSVGKFVVTNSGKLPCKKIYHCYIPSYNYYTDPSFLRNLILEMFERTHSHKNKSIAIPALGTGHRGYPREFIAQTLFEVADEFWKRHPATTLTDIRFVIYHKDEETVTAFHKTEDKYKKSVHSPVTHSPAPTPPPRRHTTLIVGTVKVKIMQGDILKMLDRVEAIFNPIDSNMTFRFGLSKFLAEKGDKYFINDSQKLVERLQKNRVVCVMMNDKVDVVHMDRTAIKENQRDTIYAALCEADRKDRKVLALPILQRDDPGEKMAADLFSALKDLQDHRGDLAIREINVVMHEDCKFVNFADKFNAMTARIKGNFAGVSEGGQVKVTLTIWSDDRKLAQQAKQLMELFTKESDTPVTVPLMLPPTIQEENIILVGVNHENVNISIPEQTSDYLMLKLRGKAGDVLGVIEEFYRCYKKELKDWTFSDVYFLKA